MDDHSPQNRHDAFPKDDETPSEATSSPSSSSPSSTPSSSSSIVKKLVVLLIAGGLFAAVYFQFGEYFSLSELAKQEGKLIEFRAENPILIYGIAFLIYAISTGLSLPGAAVLSLVFAWFFGFWRGALLVSFASTSGATIAFLLSRYLFRDAIQNKFGHRLAGFNKALEREGAFYLFTLRLIPAVPFFVINVVMGLTPMRVWTYWWVSQIGMLAGTGVYVYAGSQFPSLQELAEHGAGGVLSLQVIIAFVILGVFPIIVKKLVSRFRPTTAQPAAL